MGEMQTIGLVGGMSWESSAAYYRDLNLGVQRRLGGRVGCGDMTA